MKNLLTALCLFWASLSYSQDYAQIDSILNKLDASDTNQIHLAIEMIRVSKMTGYTKGEARALHKLGFIYYTTQSYGLSLAKFQQAIKLRERTGELGLKAMLLVNISFIFHQVKDYDKEISYANQALKFADTDSIKSFAHLCLAKGYMGKKDINKALSFLKKIVDHKEKVGDIATIHQDYLQIGNTFVRIAQYDSAIKYYWKVEKVAGNSSSILSKMYNQLGVAHHFKGRRNEAETFYKRALDQNYHEDKGCIYLNLAELTYQKGNAVQADVYLDSAVNYPHTLEHYAKTLEAMGKKDETIKAYKNLVQVTVKDYEQILPYHAAVVDAEYREFYKDQVETNKLLYKAEKEKNLYFWIILGSVSTITLAVSWRYGIKVWETYKLKKTDSIISKKYS